MTEPDDAFRGALRDLIPGYTGPQDPLPRVVASVRRRRVRQRTMLAVGSTGLAAVVALGAPALLTGGGPGGQPAAGPGPSTAQPSPFTAQPSPSTAQVGQPPELVVRPVSHGRIGTREWAIGSVSIEAGSQRCLFSDDDLFRRDTTCFGSWKAGGPVTWADQRFPVQRVTRVTGVAPAGTVRVLVRFTDGTTGTAAGVSTETDYAARFFGLVVPGERTVRDVTALNAKGAPVGPPVGPPGAPPCSPSPVLACSAPK